MCVCVCVCVCVRARARVPADCRSPPRWALACAEGDGLRGGLHAVAADAQLPVVVVPPARQQRAGVDAAEDQGEGPCVCVRARSPSLPLSLFSPPPRLAASHSRSAPVHSCGSCARALSPSVSVESDLSVRGDRGTEIQCRFLPLPLAFESVIFVSLSPSVSLSLSPSPCLLSFCRSHPLARAPPPQLPPHRPPPLLPWSRPPLALSLPAAFLALRALPPARQMLPSASIASGQPVRPRRPPIPAFVAARSKFAQQVAMLITEGSPLVPQTRELTGAGRSLRRAPLADSRRWCCSIHPNP